MAFGDIGGPITELIVTCKTPASGTVAIHKGDALRLSGPYTVAHAASNDEAVFGEAMADASDNGVPIPVKLRGICVFAYAGSAPTVNGAAGVTLSSTAGKVKAPASGNGKGVNLKVDTANALVHVLL
jgi:hypothetical protein